MSELPTEIERIRLETQKIEDEMFKQEKPKVEGELPKPPETPPVELPKEGELPREEPLKGEPVAEPLKVKPPVELSEYEKLEKKHKVLQGKYDQEVTQVHQKARESRDRAIELEDETARLRARVAELEVARPKEEVKEQKPITLEELEADPEVAYVMNTFPEVYKAVKKMFGKVSTADPSLKGRVEKIEADVKTVAETTARTSLQAFNKYLDDNVEGWRVVNRDPRFKTWLREPDRYSGKPKLELIQEASSKFDGLTVATFFEDFAKENTTPKEEDTVVDTGNIEPKPKVTPPKDVVPPKGKPPVPPKRTDADKEIITTEYITDFYDKVRRGHYIGREAEQKAEEKKIEQAVAENRVK